MESRQEKTPLLASNKTSWKTRCDGGIPPGQSAMFQKDEDIELSAIDGNVTRREHSLSNVETFMHLMKGSIGTGILFLSRALKLSGLLLGAIGITSLASLAVAAMFVLASCSRALCYRTGKSALDYGNVAFEALLPYSETAAGHFRRIVNAFLIITQFGFCCNYLLFIQQHLIVILQACGVSFDGLTGTDVERIMIGAVTVLLILSSLFRELKNFSFLSTTANIFLVVALCVVWYFTFTHLNLTEPGYGGPLKDLPLVAAAAGWPLFFGTVASTFEIIPVVLPAENKMRHPKAFPEVFLSAMSVVIAVTVMTGVMGYMTFGENIQAVLSLNLPSSGSSSWIYTVAQLLFVYTTYVTYVIEFYILMTIVEPPLITWTMKLQLKQPAIVPYVLRIGTVILIACATIVIPQLSLIVPLGGSLGSGVLAFVFPPIIYLLTFHAELAKKPRAVSVSVLLLCVSFAVLGVIGSVCGVYSSIKQIVDFYSHGSDALPTAQANPPHWNNTV